MPVYINTAEMASLIDQGTGEFYALDQDLSGNKYIRQAMWPTGGAFTFTNFPTKNQAFTVAGTAPASGTAWATPIYLPGGFVVSNITFVSGTTAGATLTRQWFGLLDSTLKLVATTADDTSTAWAASTVKTLAIAKASGATASGYKVPTTLSATAPEGGPVLYYAYFMVAASTVPTLQCVTTSAWAAGAVPKSGSTDQTSQTTPQLTDGTVTAVITANSLVPLVGIS